MRAAISVAIVCLAAAPVLAQTNQVAATAQFDQGRALMKDKKYAEACEAFETSQRLDPQNGTLFNLAECNSHIGKLATAWLAYRDLGQRDTNPGRKKEANRRAKELDKRLPKLKLELATLPKGLAIAINGDDATATVGIENPVDLGKLKIRATAPGYAPFETTKTIATEGKTVVVHIELVKGDVPVATSEPKPEPRPEPDHPKPDVQPDESHRETSHRQRNGVITAIVGGGAVIVGTVFALKARSSWNDAELLCPAHTCGTADDRARGDALVDTARSDATLATAFVIGGAAIAAVGIYYAMTPSSEHSVAIAPTTGGAAVVLGGRF